jgi:hypothetical protein
MCFAKSIYFCKSRNFLSKNFTRTIFTYRCGDFVSNALQTEVQSCTLPQFIFFECTVSSETGGQHYVSPQFPYFQTPKTYTLAGFEPTIFCFVGLDDDHYTTSMRQRVFFLAGSELSYYRAWIVCVPPGVDVMITILCNFWPKNWRLSQKNHAMIQIYQKLAVFF